MKLKKIYKFATDNYFISIFIAVIIFVGFVSVYKLFFSKSTYIYAKVKLGQGLWWANTAKPSIWLAQSLKKGDIETDLTGKPIAEIISIRYYPWYNSDQLDTYLTLKLKVTGNKKTGKYNFKRTTIGVGAPVDLEFPSVQVSGTILDLSENEFKDKYIEKTVYLLKRDGYNKDSPYNFDAIQIGDKYFDGENNVFEVLDKKLQKNIMTVANNLNAQIYERDIETTQNIFIKTKIKFKERNGQLVFGEEQIVRPGKTLNISTPNFTFSDYIIEKIE